VHISRAIKMPMATPISRLLSSARSRSKISFSSTMLSSASEVYEAKIALARDEGDWPNQACRLSGSSGPEGSVVDAGRTLEGIHAPQLTGFIAHVMSLQQVDARPARS
jgi:hypothetical protein